MDAPHIVLLDLKSGARAHELRGHKTSLHCVRWSPHSEYLLASGGIDSKIFLWDIRRTKSCLRALDQYNGEGQGNCKDLITAHSGAINGLRFTDDGLYLVSSGTDDCLRLWDVALSSNTLVNYGTITNDSQHRPCGIAVCCDTNPPVLFVPTANNIVVYDLFSGCRLAHLLGHFSLVNCCEYFSRTNQLFSGGNDLNILLWTPDTEQAIAEHKEALAKDKDLERISVNSDAWSSDDDNA